MEKIWLCIIVACTMLLTACSDDDKIPADADDNFITALTLTKDGSQYVATIAGNEITVSIPYTINLNGATADMVYTTSAKVIPNPATVTDWGSEMLFRVTSFNGETNEYTYKIVKTEIESAGDVTLKTQSDVDNFAETMISVIKGNLVIGDNAENASEITNLEALDGIKEITGTLQILDNYKGEALDGLNITKVGGIQFGTKETASICRDTYRFRLESLQEISGGGIEINNVALQFIEFDNLIKVNGNIYIKGDAVTTLSCPKLVAVDGDFDLTDNIEMPLAQFELPLLENVTGEFGMIPSDNLLTVKLPKLKITGDLNFYFGWGLKTLELPNINEINGDLTLTSRYENTAYSHTCNTELLEISGLERLTQIKGIMTISCFDALSKFPNLSSVTSLGGIILDHLDGLYNKGEICDLSNASFTSYKNIEPIIELGGAWFDKFRTKEDVSNVNVAITFAVNNDGIKPIVNLKKIGSLKISKLSLTDLSKNIETEPFPIQEIVGNFHITNVVDANGKILNLSNLKKVGGYCHIPFVSGQKLDLSNLESVGGQLIITATGTKEINIANLTEVCNSENPQYSQRDKGNTLYGALHIQSNQKINLPQLTKVGGDGVLFSNFTDIDCPLLQDAGNRMVLQTATKCETVVLPSLTSVKEILIKNLSKLSDFSTFSKVIENGQVTDGKWTVTGCKYNPTFQDMKEGRYKPTE
ncbi:MAG: hypothetical protein NC453_14210 [Muribaculum sp.]|nr:hypothetical protein [Muribaculum sp.]